MENDLSKLSDTELQEIIAGIIENINGKLKESELTEEQKDLLRTIIGVYEKHGFEFFESALLDAAIKIDNVLTSPDFIGELPYNIPRLKSDEVKGYITKYGRDPQDMRFNMQTNRYMDCSIGYYSPLTNSTVVNAISDHQKIPNEAAIVYRAAPTSLFSVLLTWAERPKTWGKLLYVGSRAELEDITKDGAEYKSSSAALTTLDEEKSPPESFDQLSLFKPLELIVKEFIENEKDPLVEDIGISKAVPFLAKEQKFKNSPSFLQVLFDSILTKLEKKGVPQEERDAIRKNLYRPFPILGDIVRIEEAKERASAEKARRKSEREQEGQETKTISPLKIGVNAEYLITSHIKHANSIIEKAGLTAEFGKVTAKDFDITKARQLAKREEARSKNTGDDGLILGDGGAKRFILASYYTNRIEAVCDAFNERLRTLNERLEKAELASERKNLEAQITKFDISVRGELASIIGEISKGNQAIARLVHQSKELHIDFPQIKPPRELKKQPNKISMETTTLLRDADAMFLKAIAENDVQNTERYARENSSIDGRNK